MEVKYYSQEKLLIFKITEEIDECKVKNIRRRADYEIERFMPKELYLILIVLLSWIAQALEW